MGSVRWAVHYILMFCGTCSVPLAACWQMSTNRFELAQMYTKRTLGTSFCPALSAGWWPGQLTGQDLEAFGGGTAQLDEADKKAGMMEWLIRASNNASQPSHAPSGAPAVSGVTARGRSPHVVPALLLQRRWRRMLPALTTNLSSTLTITLDCHFLRFRSMVL